MVDGPSKALPPVPRHATAISKAALTPIVIAKLPRAAGNGAVRRAWEKAEVDSKWEQSSWAKGRAQKEKRRNLSDFERFKVLKLRKQVSRYSYVNIPTLPDSQFSSWCVLHGDPG